MLRIAPMTEAQVPRIAALEAANFSLPWDEASVRRELENPLSLWLAAQEEDRVLGYVGSQTVFEDADILNVCTAPEARRKGVAEALMRELERSPWRSGPPTNRRLPCIRSSDINRSACERATMRSPGRTR